MPELDLWMAFLDRDDVQDLDPGDRMALVSIAVAVADNLPDVDGFLPRAALRRVPWGDGPQDLRERAARLVDAEFLAVCAEPPGWIVNGWLTGATRYQAGNGDSAAVGWGQRSSAHWKKVRHQSKIRARSARAGKASTGEDH